MAKYARPRPEKLNMKHTCKMWSELPPPVFSINSIEFLIRAVGRQRIRDASRVTGDSDRLLLGGSFACWPRLA